MNYTMSTKSVNIKLIVSLFFILASAGACASVATPPESLDRNLIISLKKNDLTSARKFLENGANPEAIFGEDMTENVVCTAIDDRKSEKLELLVEFGADPNAFWKDAHVVQRSPLVCSVLFQNFEAFEYLLKNGADPSINFVPEV